MEPFATPDDLQAGYRIMDASEMERAQFLLAYATAKMLTYMAKHGVAVDPDDCLQAEILNDTCCSVVRRAMAKETGESAVGAWGDVTVYSPAGDIYLTKAEKLDLLGTAPSQRIGYISI